MIIKVFVLTPKFWHAQLNDDARDRNVGSFALNGGDHRYGYGY
ncbi:hypothetical protein [Pseudoalteromonas luteoviolacea]|uniref:Uncharacterized protein n=1 Tax=Pseudoalteromonas luteoviolacea H33 TaxID=1365251 RepID=A0A162AKM8_9GAMM|nr:hypothetical protein [Pseudoalteromonas luteoviolacea]KZN51498.1 hypothetical protein N476_14010 [Pseudoalteromonas luteoviolacea H33]KZN71332.1 hypothetical protein N477_03415 [Pseudoalteromonas luteoviolacea H33-S]